MANSFTREFETLETLIESQFKSAEDNKWAAIALLAVVDILNEYWEIIENEETDEDLGGRTIDAIYEVVHGVIVHNELPLTEAEAIALEDQKVAQFREDLDNLGEKTGLDIHILNLEEKLRDLFDEKLDKKEEEDE